MRQVKVKYLRKLLLSFKLRNPKKYKGVYRKLKDLAKGMSKKILEKAVDREVFKYVTQKGEGDV